MFVREIRPTLAINADRDSSTVRRAFREAKHIVKTIQPGIIKKETTHVTNASFLPPTFFGTCQL